MTTNKSITPKRSINGVLLLDKPLGLTSNQVLQKIKRHYQARKAGHTGSLDPQASGMLPICFGEATKFSQYLLDAHKTYEVTAPLGKVSDTGDAEGALTTVATPAQLAQLTAAQIQTSTNKFLGKITQTPPIYSALKYQGKPLYHYARQGKTAEVNLEKKAREITIFSNQIISSLDNLAAEHYQIRFRVHCSKGTYIRSLIADIGADLGCGAYVTQLRRISVTPYEHQPSYPLAELLIEQDFNKLEQLLLPIDSPLVSWPQVLLTPIQVKQLQHGQELLITGEQFNSEMATDKPSALSVRFYANLTEHNQTQNLSFLGIGELSEQSKHFLVSKRRLVNIQ